MSIENPNQQEIFDKCTFISKNMDVNTARTVATVAMMLDTVNCLPDQIPDYTKPIPSFILEDEFLKVPVSSLSRQRIYMEGALAVLRLLGSPETRSQGETDKLARTLTHECRHFIYAEDKPSAHHGHSGF